MYEVGETASEGVLVQQTALPGKELLEGQALCVRL